MTSEPMTSDFPELVEAGRGTGWIRDFCAAEFNALRIARTAALGSVIVLCTVGSVFLTWSASPSAGATATVTFSPAAGASHMGLLEFTDGERVNVNLSAGFFQGNVLVKAIECSDPDGSSANLPRSVETCDGNTVAKTVTAQNGALSLSFEFFSLPNSALGEKPPGLSTCDLSNACVLYVGINQEDFTQTKVFSPAFYVSPVGSVYSSAVPQSSGSSAAPSASASQASHSEGAGSVSTSTAPDHSTDTTSTTSPHSATTTVPSGTPSSAPSATASSDPDGSLAYTGTSETLLGAAAVGAACALSAGLLGRRMRRVGPRATLDGSQVSRSGSEPR